MNYSFYHDKKLYDKVCNLMNEVGATNKMFVQNDLMPHQIRITAVKKCRLQNLTDEECIKEGIEVFGKIMQGHYETPKLAFGFLIYSLNGKGYWESNPEGYAYEFELVK